MKNRRRKLPTSKLNNEALRDAGFILGLQESRVFAHGLRYGGCASILAARHSILEVQWCSGSRSECSAMLSMGLSTHDRIVPLGVAFKGEVFTLQDAIR